MTDQHQERLYWDAASSDPANIGGIGMPPVEHFLNVIQQWDYGRTRPRPRIRSRPAHRAVADRWRSMP